MSTKDQSKETLGILEFIKQKNFDNPDIGILLSCLIDKCESCSHTNEIHNILENILNTNPNLIFVKDRQGRFVIANEATANIYGTSVANLIGKTDKDFNDHQDELDWYLKDDLYVIENQKEIFIPEEKVSSPDGKMQWFETIKKPMTLSNGEVCALGIAINITKRKELFEQLLQSQKLEALGQLSGGIAHDFNNILTIILGFTSIISESLSSPEVIKSAIAEIEKAVKGASDLNAKLLGFARKSNSANEQISLNQTIEDSLIVLNRTIEDNIKIKKDLSSTNDVIVADPAQIQQAIFNLIINARDSMCLYKGGKDGGEIIIKTLDEVVEFDNQKYPHLKKGSYVKFEVQDQGCGIKEENKYKVFEPFFTTKPNGYGTGLGLSLVYGIIRSIGAYIYIDSEVDIGTKISIYFPCCKEEKKEEKKGDLEKAFKTVQGDIIIIEDNLEILDVLKVTLSNIGYKIKTFSDRQQALDYLSTTDKFDIIIMDLMMPGMSPEEAFNRIRKLHPNSKIILSTGYSKNETLEKLLINTNVSFIPKPYRMSKMIKLIDEMLH